MHFLYLFLALASPQAPAPSTPPPVTMDVRNAPLTDFLTTMGSLANVNVLLHPGIQGNITLSVRDANWDALLDLVLKNYGLGREMQSNVMRIAPLPVFEQGYKQQAAVEAARQSVAPLETRVYTFNYVKAADMAPVFSKFLSPRGVVIVEPSRNMLIIRDVPDTPQADVPQAEPKPVQKRNLAAQR